ncbi:MAG TPA: SusC/RagA family TonB-linked outer membrane protein [Ferruginibacter sp.]|nr:SusC/RagA family TonB-linked outer membrane protein [Ferruginibacter sp.]HRO18409.1 SusC/RagA family TonB-linked outer membrane protein [Ferruginibacter sp.]
MAQTKQISGRVTDANGTPLSNVSVLVKGTTVGTTTAADGTYTLSVPQTARQLVFSLLSYDDVEMNIGTRTSISPVMQLAGAKDIEGVVVTGVSKIKRSEYTGAATKVTEKQLADRPMGSFDQILQGRAPGLTVLTGSGQPGQPSTVIIRGTSSINGTSDPLYIVDGIPVEAGVFQSLNPNDFASVDVLRDAAATALYGSRGSAGVMVITTKRGTSGKMKLNYSAQMGVKSRPEFAFRPMNTTELLAAQESYGIIVNPSDPQATQLNLPGYWYSPNHPRWGSLTPQQQAEETAVLDSIRGINTNWEDYIFRNGTFSNHQISISGGSGRTRLYSSVALYNEEGTTLRTDMERITFRNNIDYSDDKLTLSLSSQLGYTKRNFQQSTVSNGLGNPFLTSAIAVPYHQPVNPLTGEYNTGVGSKFAATNQLDLTKYDRNYNNQLKATLGVTADYKITDKIAAGITAGVDFRETQNTNYGSRLPFTRRNARNNGSAPITGAHGFQTEGLDRWLTTSVRPTLTYTNTFKSRHNFEATLVGEYIREFSKSLTMTGFADDPKRPGTMAAFIAGNAVNGYFHAVGGSNGQSALLSGLFMARYTLDNKYTFTGSIRRDGSSKLPEDNRWANFFSIGGSWDITKEKFMENSKFFNTLRLKANYGSAGNSNNFPGGFYPYQSTYTGGAYQGLNTIIASRPGNPSLKWETTYTLNIGMDFELADRKVYGDINWYDRRTKDLFVNKSLSATGGFGNGAALDVNAGELLNTGVELTLNWDIIRKKDLNITLFGNVAYNKNEVLSLGGEQSFEVGTERVTVGLPLGTHYEIRWAGVDAATGLPLYYGADGVITNVYSQGVPVSEFGTWEAPWKGGFGSNIRYKGFDLSVLFSWQQGANKLDNLEFFLENPVGFMSGGYNQSSSLKFWTQPGDVASTPSPLYGTNFSSKFIHDASFVRLRDVMLSYSLPKDVLARTKFISNARFFVQGSNLFIWTKWRGRDPEAGATNINLSEFPNPRTFTAGIDITF